MQAGNRGPHSLLFFLAFLSGFSFWLFLVEPDEMVVPPPSAQDHVATFEQVVAVMADSGSSTRLLFT